MSNFEKNRLEEKFKEPSNDPIVRVIFREPDHIASPIVRVKTIKDDDRHCIIFGEQMTLNFQTKS